jgi:hypothetical protein
MRYFVADVAFVIGNGVRTGAKAIGTAARSGAAFVGAAAARGRRAWLGLPLVARRRTAAALAAAVAILLFVVLAVPALPCEFPGGDRCPPADDAAEIVPDSAVAYVHVNVDPETEQYEDAAAVAEDLPLISRQVVSRVLAAAPGAGGEPGRVRRQVEPWLAGEAAIAFVPGPGGDPERVFLFEVEDAKGAARWARSIAAGATESEEYRAVEIATDERGLATAEVEDFLAVGSASAIRAVVDTATGTKGARPLADDQEAEDVREELPDHRLAEVWLSRSGSAELLAPGAPLAPLAPFVSPASTRGAAISLSAGDDSLGLAVRSELDPEREKKAPGFFTAFPDFEPGLPAELSTDALVYLGIGEPGRTVRALLRQAVTQAPGIVGGFKGLVASLREQGAIDIEKKLLPALGDEAALAIEPSGGRGGGVPTGSLPYLEFAARGVDEDRAGRAFAELQRPIAAEVDPASALQAPVFGEEEIDGVTVRTLRVTPTVELSYAVFDGLAAVATNPAGIEQLIGGEGGLDEDDDFERATEGFEDEVALLAFLDLRELLKEGFEIGLAEVPAFATFAPELRRLEALGLQVHRDGDLLASDARLLVTR